MNILTAKYGDFFRRIVESQSCSVVVLDHDLRISYLNPAAEILFAFSARRAQGLSLREMLPDPGHLESLMQESLASNHPITEREMRLSRVDFDIITVDCTLTPFDESEGKGLMVELQPMDRHLRIAREEHQFTQYQATRELLRGLAHEVKNPLGGLRGAAQLLERELQSDELKEYTQVIINEADRLRALVDRMLTPNAMPHKRWTNIHQVLERVFSLVKVEVPAGIRILRDYDPSLPEILADPDLLIQALLNIVRNAAQALGESGNITLRTRPLRQFTIGHKRHKLVLQVQIIDNGPGIPKEMQETIFFPLVTGRAEGTGLGLTIAQSLVNQHQGLIECNSTNGNTVFSVLLPVESDVMNGKEP